MKVSVKDQNKEWKPVAVEIVLETEEEAKGFRHLIGCWCSQECCSRSREAEDTASRLISYLDDLPA